MGITLAQLAANTATVTFEVKLEAEDGTSSQKPVTVVYFPGRVTEKTVALLQSFSSFTGDNLVSGLESFNQTLAGLPSLPGSGLLKSWDVYEDEAETVMFPIDAARIAQLPLTFRVAVIGAIMGNLRPEAIAPQALGS